MIQLPPDLLGDASDAASAIAALLSVYFAYLTVKSSGEQSAESDRPLFVSTPHHSLSSHRIAICLENAGRGTAFNLCLPDGSSFRLSEKRQVFPGEEIWIECDDPVGIALAANTGGIALEYVDMRSNAFQSQIAISRVAEGIEMDPLVRRVRLSRPR